MSTLVFDIETVGEDFESFDDLTKEALIHSIKREATNPEEYKIALEELNNTTGLSPLTGEIVAIGVLDVEKNEGGVYFQAPDKKVPEFKEDGIKFKAMSEKEMLETFWKLATKFRQFVSFNGKGFDAPFMAIRSAVHKIKPSKDLNANRYLNSQPFDSKHIDLYDQLTFYGSMRKRGSLHMWTRAFGIKSPKDEGITGAEVGKFFKEGRYEDIARYNVRDLRSTKELYEYWRDYLTF